MCKKFFTTFYFVIMLGQVACVEEFNVFNEVGDQKPLLVVDAVLTDELKKQMVLLSRLVDLGEEQDYEENAEVYVVDDNGLQFPFEEKPNGRYISINEFKIADGRSYQLLITTADGEKYKSKYVQVVGKSIIEELYEQRSLDEAGDGVSIFVRNNSEVGNFRNYRYSYEETFKIIAPRWSPFDMIVIRDIPPYEVGIKLRAKQERVCYRTESSNRLILNETNPISVSNSTPTEVNRLYVNEYKISYRYSILVFQYLISRETYEYYSKLQSFSKSDNLFSEIQTGFLESNISSENDNSKVLGYFQVSSVDSKRLYFNYVDVFPDEEPPPYFINCNFLGAPRLSVPNVGSPLIDGIKSGLIKYVGENENSPPFGDDDYAPFLTTPRVCGDCTALGSNVRPSFWED